MIMPKRRYQRLAQAMRHVPVELTTIQIKCPNSGCGALFKPNWLEKIPPVTPIKSQVEQDTKWVYIAKLVECPNCHTSVMLPLPIEEQKAEYSFFGDEAYRPIDNKHLLTYSLVGTNRERLPEVEEAIREFKSRLCPSVLPDSWRLHMVDIWPPHARQRHHLFKDWDSNFVKDFSRQFFELIRSFDEAFVVLNVSSIYYTSKDKKRRALEMREARHEAYSLLLMSVINDATKSGIKPYFMFDSDKDSEADHVIHGWAKDAFQGSQLNLLYGYMARGIEIPEPEFVRPASRPCLEVADFVSYVIARYCFRRLKGAPIDLNPKQLGPVVYLGFEAGTGDMLYRKSTGYPWKLFYGDA